MTNCYYYMCMLENLDNCEQYYYFNSVLAQAKFEQNAMLTCTSILYERE